MREAEWTDTGIPSGFAVHSGKISQGYVLKKDVARKPENTNTSETETIEKFHFVRFFYQTMMENRDIQVVAPFCQIWILL